MATDLTVRSWAACLALALHNSEEIAAGLPAWLSRQPQLSWLDRMHGGDWFVPAAIALALLAAGFAIWTQIAPMPWMRPALLIFAIVMLANAGSHMAMSLVAGSIMPGTITAALVLLPVFGWILFSLVRQK